MESFKPEPPPPKPSPRSSPASALSFYPPHNMQNFPPIPPPIATNGIMPNGAPLIPNHSSNNTPNAGSSKKANSNPNANTAANQTPVLGMYGKQDFSQSPADSYSPRGYLDPYIILGIYFSLNLSQDILHTSCSNNNTLHSSLVRVRQLTTSSPLTTCRTVISITCKIWVRPRVWDMGQCGKTMETRTIREARVHDPKARLPMAYPVFLGGLHYISYYKIIIF